MNVADTCCQEIHTQISNGLALLRICALAHAYNTVFLSADGADFRLNGNSLAVSSCNQLGCLCYILFNGIMRTVKHNRGKTCLDTFVAMLIGTMIQMQSNGNIDIQIL